MPIEHTTLRPARGSGNGLTGEYFRSPDLSGQPVLTRTDRNINFNWDKVVPVNGLERNHYSVRWSGSFTPPVRSRKAAIIATVIVTGQKFCISAPSFTNT